MYCPNCGTARVGSFRFCMNCKFDFDAAGQAPAPPPSSPPPNTGQPPQSGWQQPQPQQRAPVIPTITRQEYASSARAMQSLGCLVRSFVVIGALIGFVVGAYLGFAIGGFWAPLILGFVVGPLVGAFAASRLALSIWASRG